ncbi:MAG: L-ribulose-5-phosphate 3-epimerase [Sphaerochaeta sp.]|nr:L-ribulose-5-phosphate 3-epimerase [Sphaerochaeta sp.]
MFEHYSIGIYEKAFPATMSWEKRFSSAKAIGFDFLELSIDAADERLARLDWSLETCRDFIRLQHQAGIRVSTLCLSGLRRYPIGSPSPKVRENGMLLISKAIRLASHLGIRIVQLAGYDVYAPDVSSDQSVELFHQNIGRAVAEASTYGVILAIENMEVPFADSLTRLMSLVSYYDSPYLQLYADIGNLSAMGKDLNDELQAAQGHIAAIHVKDTVAGICRDIPFSKGTVNFEEAFRSLRAIGYTGMLMLEMWAQPEEDPMVACSEAYGFITERMKRAGLQ